MQIWDAINGGNVYIYHGHIGRVNAVSWSPTENVSLRQVQTTVQVWDAVTGGNVYIYRGHTDHVNAVAWSANGIYIATGSDDHSVQVWDATTGIRQLFFILDTPNYLFR